MWHIILRIIAVLVTSYVTHVGVPLTLTVNTLWIAFLVTIVLAIINHTIKPLLTIVLIPIHFATLGLSSLFVNGAMILLASYLIPGFIIPSILMGFWFSIVLSIVNWVLHIFEKD
ncbi:MAG: putative rane protein [Patescibacteria group bacterium]|nr:putative rane protein [Patescibacteria group bacterium]